jgi:hypothetical protein
LRWFSNHLLVTSLDPDAIKAAVRNGRVYGVFEILGAPIGFDYHAEADGFVAEMGETVAVGSDLVVDPPSVSLAAGQVAPTVRVRLLQSSGGGTGNEVASASDGQSLRFTAATPGAYRVEVRMTPNHLTGYMGGYSSTLLKEYVWIYSNPIYVE